MLQAKILMQATTAIAGETITLPQLSDAVDKFNADGKKLVTMEDWPAPWRINLDKVAAKATLYLDGGQVIADMKLLETPLGSIVSQLNDAGVKIYLKPVTTVVPSNNECGRRLRIERLVIVANPASPMFDSPLKIVKDWVSGEIHTPMYEIIDK